MRRQVPFKAPAQGGALLWPCVLALLVSVLATLAARALLSLIGLITRLAFHGAGFSGASTPMGHSWGAWVILVPVVGSMGIVALARWGTRSILGHGIPELMERVLSHRSRISPKTALLKPLGSALSIGTGGPYGAEGPVIATGSALGSLVGQAFTLTAVERRLLLAAGGASAMTAVFGCPLAATLLAVELLLFEFKLRSLVPVLLAASLAQALRVAAGEPSAVFASAQLGAVRFGSWPVFLWIGLLCGLGAVFAIGSVHAVEGAFSGLKLSWMIPPLLGGAFVGLLGWRHPEVFGASYGLIEQLLSGQLPLLLVAVLCGFKLAAWIVSLGSGTSGGTLAPMLVAGGGLGMLASSASSWFGFAAVSPGLAALVGMVAFFAAGSRALFASIVLGVEITQQSAALWPSATAAAIAVLTARLLSRQSLMTAPVSQRGVAVPEELGVDVFAQVRVGSVMAPAPPPVSSALSFQMMAERLAAHDPDLGAHDAWLVEEVPGVPRGLLTRRDLQTALREGRGANQLGERLGRPLVSCLEDETLQDALSLMHHQHIGRLLVRSRENSDRVLGYLDRAAVLSARRHAWVEENEPEQGWLHGWRHWLKTRTGLRR